MNKVLLLVGALLLAGCVSAPESRPKAYTEAEQLLNTGVAAYRADDYATAAVLFRRALHEYRGLNSLRGMCTSRINLAETALAVRNYDAARRHSAAADALAVREGWSQERRRVRLLQVRAAAGAGQKDAAIATLEPLLPAPGEAADAVALNALAVRMGLALDTAQAPGHWVDRFAVALADAGEVHPLLTARLLRARAQQAADPATADRLFEQALATYRAAAARPGTARTLEEWGGRLAAAGEWHRAEEKLIDALNVRLWLLDRAGTAEGLRQLARVNRNAGDAERAGALERWAEIVASRQTPDWGTLQRELLPY